MDNHEQSIRQWFDIIGHVRLGLLHPVVRPTTIQAAATELSDTYFHPAKPNSKADKGSWKMGEDAIESTKWLWVDADTKLTPGTDEHTSWCESVRDFAVSESVPTPKYIVDSGRGLQLWWELTDDETDSKIINETLKGLCVAFKDLGGDSAPTNVASVMRVPYTYHTKTGGWGSGWTEIKSGMPVRLVDIHAQFKITKVKWRKTSSKFDNRLLDYVDIHYAFEPNGQFFVGPTQESDGSLAWSYIDQAHENGLRCVERTQLYDGQSVTVERWNIRSMTLAKSLRIPNHDIANTYSGLDMLVMTECLGTSKKPTGGPQGDVFNHRKRRFALASELYPNKVQDFSQEASETMKAANVRNVFDALEGPPWEWRKNYDWETANDGIRVAFYEPKVVVKKGIVSLEYDPSQCHGTNSGFRIDRFSEQVLKSAVELGRSNGHLAVYDDGVWHNDTERIGVLNRQTLGDMWRTGVDHQLEAYLMDDVNLSKIEPGKVRDGFLLNVKNGMVDLRDGTHHPHSAKHMCSVQIPVEFDASMDCPMWLKAIQTWQKDEAMRLACQMIFGMALTTGSGNAQVFFLFGTGSNGKSQYLDILRKLLGGRQNVSALKPLQLGDRFMPAQLAGKIANIAGEIPDTGLNEKSLSILKDLTGGDSIMAEHKNKSPFALHYDGIFIFAGNRRPSLKDVSQGLMRRVVPLPWLSVIDAAHDIKDYAEILWREESQGILNWAVEGARLFVENGYTVSVPDSVEESKLQWVDDSNQYVAFFNERVELSPEKRTKSSELWVAFLYWLVEEGKINAQIPEFMTDIDRDSLASRAKKELGLSLQAFGSEIGKHFMDNVTQKKSNGLKYWVGIALKEPF